MFQALLRNPLASPDTLGVSAGAALGAMLAITFNVDFALLRRLGGAAGELRRLDRRARHRLRAVDGAAARHVDASVLLLAGVTLTALLSAVIAFVQYLARLHRNVPHRPLADGIARRRQLHADRWWRWCRWRSRMAGFATLPRVLDLDQRRRRVGGARGVDVDARRADRAGQRVAGDRAAVSLAGPIAFVGIIVPHLVRLIVGADHRLVLPASALFGGAFLIGCDVVARTSFAPLELPVGIVTAIIGGPFFLWLLFRKTRMTHADAPAELSGRLRWLLCSPGLSCARRTAALADAADRARIISLIPATTEMLFAMGAGDRVVGVGNYDDFPPEVERLPRVGGLLDPERRAHPVAEAGPGHRLRHADRPERAARPRAACRCIRYRPRGLPDITQTMRSARRAGRREGRRGDAAAAAHRAAARRVRARVAGRGRGRKRCWCSAASRARCGTSTPAAATGSCTTCSRSPAAPTSSAICDAAVGRHEHRDDPGARAGGDHRAALRRRRHHADSIEAERRVWNALPSVPAVRNQRVHLLTATSSSSPGRASSWPPSGSRATLHPEAFK